MKELKQNLRDGHVIFVKKKWMISKKLDILLKSMGNPKNEDPKK
jgi:hypothetical protein